jgi:hypothetical protein
MDSQHELDNLLLLRSNSTAHMTCGSDWLENCGKFIKNEFGPSQIFFNIWLPIPVNKESPWRDVGSSVLHHFSGDCKNHWQLVKMLQYMFLCTELGMNGTPHISLNRYKYPLKFKQIIEAYCKCYLGCKNPRAEDWALCKDYIKSSPEFDPTLPPYIDIVKKELDTKNKKQQDEDEDDSEDLVPTVVELEPFPEGNPGAILEWIRKTNEYIQRNPNITAADFPENIRRHLIFHNEALRREDMLERVERLENSERWVQRKIPKEKEFIFMKEFEMAPCMIYTGENTKNYLSEKGVDVTKWPFTNEDTPFIIDQVVDENVPKSISLSSAKINVVWFFFDEEKKDGLFCFSILDPLWCWRYPFEFLLKHSNQKNTDSNKKRPWGQVSRDPLSHLRHLGKSHIANEFNEPFYEDMISYFLSLENSKNELKIQGDYVNTDTNSAFLPNILTLKNALKILRFCNVPNLDRFNICGDGKKCLKYPEGIVSYTLHPKMCIWFDSIFIGIGFTQWPNQKKIANFALDLIMGKQKIENGKLQKKITNTEFNQERKEHISSLKDFVSSYARQYINPLINKQNIKALQPKLLNFETGDLLTIWQAETDKAMEMLNQLFPNDPENEREQYNEYCNAMEEMRNSGLQKHCSIWGTDGMVKNKALFPSVICAISYIADFLSKSETKLVTCWCPYLDEDLSIWGNNIMKVMLLLRQGRTIIKCDIPLIAMALNSTFDKHREGEVRFNFGLCGPAEAGKTYPLFSFMNNCQIFGTTIHIRSQSERAGNIDGHIGPGIVLIDEPEKWILDSKQEDKYYERVQEFKDVLTSGQRSRTVLTMVEVDGQQMRVPKHLLTKDSRVYAICSNQARDKSSAITSRFCLYTISKPVKPPELYHFDAAQLSGDSKEYFKLNQGLAIEVYHAIIEGVIPDIDMWLFNMVTVRCFTIWRKWNVVETTKGDRARQILRAFVRHQIIIKAIVSCRHMPGGALYNVPYSPEDIYKIGPYCVCTLEIIYASIHLLASEIIDEDCGNVIRAMCKNCSYDISKSAYVNYTLQRSVDDIPFKVIEKKNLQENGTTVKDKWLLDLNYLTIEGTKEQIAMKTSRFTDPPLSDSQVSAVLKTLCEKSFPPVDETCYVIETKNRLEQFVYLKEPCYVNDEQVIVDEETYKKPCHSIIAAEYSTMGRRGALHFCPALVDLLDIGVIDRGFYLATMCSTFPKQKAIKGLVNKDEPDLFRVAVWNQKFINDWVEKIDEDSPDVEIKRSEGISITTKEKLTEMEQDILLNVTVNPSRKDHDSTYWKYIEKRSIDYRVVNDWETEAAKRVAFKCGVRINENTGLIPYYDEKRLRKDYETYCRLHPECYPTMESTHKYPASIIKDRARSEKIENAITTQMTKGKAFNIPSEKTSEEILGLESMNKIKVRRSGHKQTASQRRLALKSPNIVRFDLARQQQQQPRNQGDDLLRKIGL